MNLCRLSALSICCIINIFGKADAQSIHPNNSTQLYYTGLSFHQGIIVTDSKQLKPLAQSHPAMVELEFSSINNTQKAWNQCMCYSKTGFSFRYINFNNNKNLGKAIDVAVFSEPYLYYSPKIKLSLKGSAGLSYLTNPFDSLTNPLNLFFSSPISFLISLGTSISYKISPSFDFGFTTQFNHISNGGTRYPNWGINFPTVAVMIDYKIDRQELAPRNHEKMSSYPLKLVVHSSAGRHLEDGMKRFVTGINFGLIKQLSRVNGIGVGGEIIYDRINKVLEDRTGDPYNIFITSVSIQHYLLYGKLLFSQQLAYYITPPSRNITKKIYQTYFLEYHITKQWYGGISLKAHGAISDYLSFSIGKVILLR